ncbi:hypothetical protein pb186bvf_005045 [Paramecium bursaria]
MFDMIQQIILIYPQFIQVIIINHFNRIHDFVKVFQGSSFHSSRNSYSQLTSPLKTFHLNIYFIFRDCIGLFKEEKIKNLQNLCFPLGSSLYTAIDRIMNPYSVARLYSDLSH